MHVDDDDNELEAKKKRLQGELWQPETSRPSSQKAQSPDPSPPQTNPKTSRTTPSDSAIQALNKRLDAYEALLIRILETTSKTPAQESGVDAWIASIINDQRADGERSTYSARLSDTNRSGLESATKHRGHRTISDALDEALRIGITALLRLPANRCQWKRRGRKKNQKMPSNSSLAYRSTAWIETSDGFVAWMEPAGHPAHLAGCPPSASTAG